jgi:hypothetical protein
MWACFSKIVLHHPSTLPVWLAHNDISEPHIELAWYSTSNTHH